MIRKKEEVQRMIEHERQRLIFLCYLHRRLFFTNIKRRMEEKFG